ncbi:unnamed protein product, partial [Sphagnum tenellum]
MLDIRYFQDKIGDLEQALQKRNAPKEFSSKLVEFSKRRRELVAENEKLKAQKNQVSQEIADLKSKAKTKTKAKPDLEAESSAETKVQAMRELGDRIKVSDESLKVAEENLQQLALQIPNIPHSSVPEGLGSESNVLVRSWGMPRSYSFQPQEHVELGEKLGILDFEKGVKLAGARFVVYFGAGAALERALIQFMLDLHTREHGYQEVIPPFLVNRPSMIGTGQLPKFEEDLFKTGLSDRELFLIPTAEVPLTNLLRGEIVEKESLPRFYTAYSPCFRSEAGSYGKDTRGLIRQHQFQKVELVKIVEPQHSYDELEKMLQNAEKVLQLLELPYRVMALCSGDLGFQSAKTYDIEVWLPGQGTYREISSVSNCEDFQARRSQIKYRPSPQVKPAFVHTLNGSGLAVGRTFIAILENYQDGLGNIEIPKVLESYLRG